MFRFLRLFLHSSLGSLLPHPKGEGGAGSGVGSSTKREGEVEREGRGGEKAKQEHS